MKLQKTTEPIRVLHVVGVMNLGGTENMIMNLYRNIDRSKIQFDFVQCTSDSAAFDEEIYRLGGRIYRCPQYNGINHFEYVKWWKKFFSHHEREYSIVHGHIGSTAAIYLSIARDFGIYTIAHSHSNGMSFLYRLYSYPTRFIAESFFACSNEAAESRYGKKISQDTKRCAILKNAINITKFVFDEERRDVIRDELGISENTFVLGHVGQFREEKNHSFLLDVFEEFHKLHQNTVLLLVGDGKLKRQLENTVKQKGLVEFVIFVGAKTNANDYYQAMDAFVFPSLYEGLGISVIEAQTSGLPCYISDTIPQVVAVTEGLVEYISLSQSPNEWASRILNAARITRIDRTSEIQNAGYDISCTSKWLQDFYLRVLEKMQKN